jgi:LysW-gamma-L-lysine carboxypeptidase
MTVTTGVAVDELLLDMLGIPSPTGSEWRIAAWLRDRLETLGFAAHVDAAGNCVATWGDGPVEVMLLGHLDTVPGSIAARRDGDLLRGRGAVDAKGPLAAAVAAVTQQPRNGGVRYTVIGCADEEGDSRGARHLLAARGAPQHLIVLEPSGWDAVTIGYRGVVRATFSVSSSVHHRAAPIASAADTLVGLVGSLQHELDDRNGDRSAFHRLDLRVTRLGTSTDGLGETAECTAQFRLPTDVSAQELMGWVDERRGDAEFLVQFAVDAVRGRRDSAVARALTAAIRAEGGRPRHKVKTGTADMNLLAPRWGIDAVAYGPGDSHLDHTPDEAISIVELEQGVRVISAALAHLR